MQQQKRKICQCCLQALSISVYDMAGEPETKDLELIRTRKPEAPVIEVELKDGTRRRLWCTFGTQQIDIDPFSPSGKCSVFQRFLLGSVPHLLIPLPKPIFQDCSRTRGYPLNYFRGMGASRLALENRRTCSKNPQTLLLHNSRQSLSQPCILR